MTLWLPNYSVATTLSAYQAVRQFALFRETPARKWLANCFYTVYPQGRSAYVEKRAAPSEILPSLGFEMGTPYL